MKHLKKFNEELKPSTYLTASKKLKKLGHERRSKELEMWGKEVENRVSNEKWKKNIETYSSFGKVTIKFMKKKSEVFRGDFYLTFTFDDTDNEYSIIEAKKSGGYFDFKIQFAVGLIPVDEETLQKCLSKFPESYFGNGFFWGNWVGLEYKVENEKINFNKISIYPYDEELTFSPELVDRRGALFLKKSLMACLDEGQDYPSSDTRFQIMYDLLYRCICQECEMLVDYDFDIERVLNDVKGYSHNYFFKD
jgi:hypothetical protein